MKNKKVCIFCVLYRLLFLTVFNQYTVPTPPSLPPPQKKKQATGQHLYYNRNDNPPSLTLKGIVTTP